MGGRDSLCNVSRDLISILEFSNVSKALPQKIFLNICGKYENYLGQIKT